MYGLPFLATAGGGGDVGHNGGCHPGAAATTGDRWPQQARNLRGGPAGWNWSSDREGRPAKARAGGGWWSVGADGVTPTGYLGATLTVTVQAGRMTVAADGVDAVSALFPLPGRASAAAAFASTNRMVSRRCWQKDEPRRAARSAPPSNGRWAGSTRSSSPARSRGGKIRTYVNRLPADGPPWDSSR